MKFSDEPDSNVNGGIRLRLTRLAAAIYDARPELQRYFRTPAGTIACASWSGC